MRWSVPLSLAATALVVGLLPNCSSDGDGSASGTCGQYYDAYAGFYQRCLPSSAAALNNARPRFIQLCTNALAAPGAGDLGATFSRCSGVIASAACGDEINCDEDIVGTLPEGSACLEGYQCASGGCDGKNGVCGKCIALAAVGDTCSTSKPCVKNAECVFDSATGTCRATTIAKEGESCDFSASETTVKCDSGLRCNSEAGKLVCRKPGAASAACESSDDCQSDLVCKDKVCGAGTPLGGDCANFTGCARGLVCGTDNKCAQFTLVGTGQPCDLLARGCLKGRCKGAAVSVGSSGTKVTPGVCEDPIPDGSPCTVRTSSSSDTPSCDVLAECVNGVCQLPNPASCK